MGNVDRLPDPVGDCCFYTDYTEKKIVPWGLRNQETDFLSESLSWFWHLTDGYSNVWQQASCRSYFYESNGNYSSRLFGIFAQTIYTESTSRRERWYGWECNKYEYKYAVKCTTGLKKDHKRAIKRGRKIKLLEQVMALLALGEPLPEKNWDHK